MVALIIIIMPDENDKTQLFEMLDKEMNEKPADIKIKIRDWFAKHSWSSNPFTLSIIPSLFIGYEEQKNKIITSIEERHKVCLIVGPTGSGKTTSLKWLVNELKKDSKFMPIFISKPPAKPDDFVAIFNDLFRPPWFLAFLNPFIPNIKKVHQIPDFLNHRLSNEKQLILMCDEIHEANINVLQWLRVLTDQINNMSLILSGLPVFENTLKKKLETFYKRITAKVSLTTLTKEQTKELIEKRIGIVSLTKEINNPFSEQAINLIFEQTGGFPREVLRLCDQAVNEAIEKGLDTIEPDMIQAPKVEKIEKSEFDLKALPKRQREIIEAIQQGKTTPNDIVDSLNLEKYKSKEHAIRSVNNILQRLMKDNIVKRGRQGKTYIYSLAPKIKNLVVSA